jgi:glucose-1-phosphate adenylyltransferase
MDYGRVKKGSRIKRTIIDRFNSIDEHTYIGYDTAKDKANYSVSPTGIVVVKRGPRRMFYW